MTGIVEKLDSLADDLERDDNVCWIIVVEARIEIERLTKEVEGLRGVLTEIAGTRSPSQETRASRIARAALTPREEGA